VVFPPGFGDGQVREVYFLLPSFFRRGVPQGRIPFSFLPFFRSVSFFPSRHAGGRAMHLFFLSPFCHAAERFEQKIVSPPIL